MEASELHKELIDEINLLRRQLEDSNYRLEEANEIINAIRAGEVDALVVRNSGGHQLYTLKSADQTYRIFIEQMTEGAVTLNRNGDIIYCNSQFASLVKLPLEKTIGQSFYRFIDGASEEECRQLIDHAWSENTRAELGLRTSQGTEIPVLLSMKTLDLDEGLSMSVIVADLSRQKAAQKLLLLKNLQLEEAQREAQRLNASLEKAVKERTMELEVNIEEKTEIEEELRRNQARLTRILETMAEGVGIINTDGALTYANPMAQTILGAGQSEKLEHLYFNPDWKYYKIDGSVLQKREHPVIKAITTGEPVYDFEIAIERPGTERFYISVNAAPIRNDRDTIVAAVGTFMDVTNRRKAIQQKDEFISIASHELKTPITSLKASLQLLSRMKNNPSNNKFPDLIDQANKSLNKVSILISDLLNSSKITGGQLELSRKNFVLSKLVEDCCNYVRSEGVYKIHTDGDLDLAVFADANRIEQVIVNFVDNAIKYSPQSYQINIHIEKDGDSAKVSVRDFGPGIPQDKLPHLFDRYFRIDSSGSQYSGLGLGLYICSEIIKKHNGRIGVESVLNEGSTFWFTLPL